MNKTKQEMLALVKHLEEKLQIHSFVHPSVLQQLRNLITDSVILSDGEIDGMRASEERPTWENGDPQWWEECAEGHNAALDKIKEQK